MKTTALVLEQFNAPLELREFEVPPPDAGQILLRIEAAGICGSDVHMWRGHDERTPLPIILGHEGVGIVEEVRGKRTCLNGAPIKPGDRLAWNRGITCGRCYFCAVAKEPSLCENRKVYGINRPANVAPYLNGCYARHIILTKDTDLVKIDQSVDPSILVAASCSGATVAHGFDLCPPKPGDVVLVQGPGPLGLFAIAFARAHGASEVVVIGGSRNRLEICEQFGASVILNRKTLDPADRKQAVMDLTHGRGVDLVVEAAGQPEAVGEGLSLLRRGGTYLSTGFSQPPATASVDFFQDVVKKNARVQGVWVSDAGHLHRAINLVLQNQELFAKIVTHRFPLEQGNGALRAMESREALKAVLNP